MQFYTYIKIDAALREYNWKSLGWGQIKHLWTSIGIEFVKILQWQWVLGKIKVEVIAFYWRRQWHPTPVLLPGKPRGWRILLGFSPWVAKLDTTEQLHFHFSLPCIGEGKGNPLQCSCLENPRDEEAWWAAVSGVTQSRTRLKWLSSIAFHADK